MKKASFIFLLLCNSFCFSQTTKLVPLYVLLPSYTQVQEDSIALTYNVSEPGVTNQNIWNSDLLKTRIWNGTEFTSVPDLPARSLPVASQTSPGAVPQTGIPTGKVLKDDLTWGVISGGAVWGGITGLLTDQLDLQTALNTKLSATGNGSLLTGLTKAQVGLPLADNTSDLNKPISTATQTALNTKQPTLISATNIKTINGVTVLGSGDIVISGGSPTFINLVSNFSSISVTPATVTGWSFAVTTGRTYRVTVIAAYQTAALTTGGIIGVSLTTATGTVRGTARGTISQAAAATELVIPIRTLTGAGSTLTTTGVTVINSPHSIELDLTFTCTLSGTFNIVWGTEVVSSAAQLNSNSSLIYQLLN